MTPVSFSQLPSIPQSSRIIEQVVKDALPQNRR